MTSLLLTNLAILIVCAFTLWSVCTLMKDASIVDRFWGMGFVVAAVSTFLLIGETTTRGWLMLGLVTLWGLRLSLYLTKRNWGHGEDYRYQAMRRYWGDRFWWISFFTVFMLQAVLCWFVSLPAQFAIASDEPTPLGVLDYLGVSLFAIGFFFEVVGDAQLSRFKADPANGGQVMNRGLWRYTRHPNYFGDALLWWGLYAIAASTDSGRWTVLSPVVMTFLLMRVSGVPMLEKKLKRTRPEYADYVARTNAFVPWFRKAAPEADASPTK